MVTVLLELYITLGLSRNCDSRSFGCQHVFFKRRGSNLFDRGHNNDHGFWLCSTDAETLANMPPATAGLLTLSILPVYCLLVSTSTAASAGAAGTRRCFPQFWSQIYSTRHSRLGALIPVRLPCLHDSKRIGNDHKSAAARAVSGGGTGRMRAPTQK